MNAYTIRRPVITEKSLAQANKDNTYTFLVERGATKDQVKTAIQTLFGVTVVRVRTILNAPEVKRTGRKRVSTHSAKQKKALVTLKAGESISLFDVGGQE